MITALATAVLLAALPPPQTDVPPPLPIVLQDSPSPPGTKHGIGTGGLYDRGYAPGGSKCTLDCGRDKQPNED